MLQQGGRLGMAIKFCHHCSLKVLPAEDGTCPQCHIPIEQSKHLPPALNDLKKHDTIPKVSSSVNDTKFHTPFHKKDSAFRAAVIVGIIFCSAIIMFAIGTRKIIILQDLPDHIGRAAILKDYFFSPFFQEYFRLAWFPTPYVLPDIVNALLLIFFDPVLTSKLYSLFAVFFLIAGSLFCVHRNSPGLEEIALFPFAIVLTNIFFKGNLNFLLGVGFFLFLAGYWWPKRSQTSVRQDLLIAAAGVILYGIHLICLMAWYLIFIIRFFLRYAHSAKVEWKTLWPLLPSGILTTIFFMWDGSGATTNADELALRGISAVAFSNIWANIKALGLFFGTTADNTWLVFIPVFALYSAAAIFSLIKIKFSAEWLIFSILLGGFLIAPPELPNLVRPGERLLFIALFWGMLIIKHNVLWHKALRWSWIITMCFACALLSFRFCMVEKSVEQRYLSYLDGLKTVPENSVICPVKFRTENSFMHIDKFLPAMRQSIVPGIFIPKHIILRYRKHLPVPPRPPHITREMLKTYRYFIFSGASDQTKALISQGTFKIRWNNPEAAIIENCGFSAMACK